MAENYSRMTLRPSSPPMLDPDQPQRMKSPHMYVIKDIWAASGSGSKVNQL